ncbi:MAG: TnsA-like heteromeric transposase endonuclease subunit [Nocardioidaceae bacterium]
MAEAWAVPLERGRPVRRFTSRKGQRHLSGLWWSATVGGHVGFESLLERDHLMLLDFDLSVVGIASQPFWLRWSDEDRKTVSHSPDFFARRANGSAVVIDCRPADRRPARDAAKFDATARACALLEWEYRLVGATDGIVTANVRWLAGYRHPRHLLFETAAVLREVFAMPTPLLAGAQEAGDPMAVLPVLFHLLWCRELAADLSVPLHPDTVVTGGAAGR